MDQNQRVEHTIKTLRDCWAQDYKLQPSGQELYHCGQYHMHHGPLDSRPIWVSDIRATASMFGTPAWRRGQPTFTTTFVPRNPLSIAALGSQTSLAEIAAEVGLGDDHGEWCRTLGRALEVDGWDGLVYTSNREIMIIDPARDLAPISSI